MKTMKTYQPTSPHFITPPECQGQMIVISYAIDADAEVIIECTCDRSTGSVSYVAYSYPDDLGSWAPQNGAPELGECRGECRIRD